MINIWLLVLIVFLPARQQRAGTVRWALTKACTLNVNGSTNINKFSCVIPEYIKPDTLLLTSEGFGGEVKITGQMKLNVNSFDCHNGMMTKDLRKTLKADKYPHLIVRFMSLKKYPATGVANVTGLVMISLAGVTKQFEVEYTRKEDHLKTMTLVGRKQVTFTDFNITPPRKLGGMIKTNDLLDVEFTLRANLLN